MQALEHSYLSMIASLWPPAKIIFGILFLGLAGFFARVLVDFLKKGSQVGQNGYHIGYGINNWRKSVVANINSERPSHSVAEGLASETRNNRVYPKFESAPTENGMF